MKVPAIDSLLFFKQQKLEKRQKNECVNSEIKHSENYKVNSYLTNVTHVQLPKTVIFRGYKVHIVDGGDHAQYMNYFAKAINKQMDVTLHNVLVNSKQKDMKQLDSLERQLKILNQKSDYRGEYVAVPALASVPLLNIQDQYNAIMKSNKKFTPENVKSNKKSLLKFLKELYDYPAYYAKYIGYMDENKQGIQYVYGVITEINKLIEKGAKVFIPSGHPQDQTLKWMAAERGLKPELYHFIATGEDINGSVRKMHKEIKDKNWYDFNLLSLSDAKVVGVKGVHGAQDYMFAAYDSCVTDGARGVYNFSPVRRNNRLVGYSYTDTKTNQFPYDKFPANEHVANIARFVGLPVAQVRASQAETKQLKRAIDSGSSTIMCANKLYLISDLFTPSEIRYKKLDIQGRYINRDLNLIFDKNSEGLVIFPKCDCEGSGKPSVLSMWGSCFAVFNAISADIDESEKSVEYGASNNFVYGNEKMEADLAEIKDSLKVAEWTKDYKGMELLYNRAIKIYDIFLKRGSASAFKERIERDKYLDKLADVLVLQSKYSAAKAVLNRLLREEACSYFDNEEKLNDVMKWTLDIDEKERYAKEVNSARRKRYYDELSTWNNAFLGKLFMDKPVEPTYLPLPPEHTIRSKNMWFGNFDVVAKIYDRLATVCSRLGETYSAKVCQAAAKDIRNLTPRGKEVLIRCMNNVQYIGDLYSEIKP